MPGFDTRYIADLLRREDRDRYLTTLLAPAAVRADLMLLYAFAAETARIRGAVSEALIGRVKLQWWRDVIVAIYEGKGAPKGNPLTEGLAAVIGRHHLSRSYFETMLVARVRELAAEDEGRVMGSIADLESYAEETAARETWLALEILGAPDAASQAAGRLSGIGSALCRILQALPFEVRHNRLHFAQAASTDSQGAISELARAIAGRAAQHIADARALRDRLPRHALPALLPTTIAGRVIDQLTRCGNDVFDERFARPVNIIPALIWNAMRDRF